MFAAVCFGLGQVLAILHVLMGVLSYGGFLGKKLAVTMEFCLLDLFW